MEVRAPIEISAQDREAHDAAAIGFDSPGHADLRLWALAPPNDEDYPTFLEALVLGAMLSETALYKA